MKNKLGYILVGVAGYLIGFYEYKHRVTTVIAEGLLKEKEENKKKDEES